MSGLALATRLDKIGMPICNEAIVAYSTSFDVDTEAIGVGHVFEGGPCDGDEFAVTMENLVVTDATGLVVSRNDVVSYYGLGLEVERITSGDLIEGVPVMSVVKVGADTCNSYVEPLC